MGIALNDAVNNVDHAFEICYRDHNAPRPAYGKERPVIRFDVTAATFDALYAEHADAMRKSGIFFDDFRSSQKA